MTTRPSIEDIFLDPNEFLTSLSSLDDDSDSDNSSTEDSDLSLTSPTFNEIVTKHLGYAAEIGRWLAIRDHLIKEIRKKVQDPKVRQLGHYALFLGRRSISDMDPWPADYRRLMCDALYCDLNKIKDKPSDWDGTFVYYGLTSPTNPYRNEYLGMASVDFDMWTSGSYENVIYHYLQGLFTFVDCLCDEMERVRVRDIGLAVEEWRIIKRCLKTVEDLLNE